MVDTALKNAMAARDSLAAKINSAQQEIDEWRRELTRVDSFIEQWHAFAGTNADNEAATVSGGGLSFEHIEARGPASAVAPVSERVIRLTKTAVRNSKKELVAEATRKLIEEKGEPLLRRDLLPLLQQRGLVIEGADPDMVLSTMLWRAGDDAGVIRLKRGGYWLKEKPWPEGLYHPQMAGPGVSYQKLPNPIADQWEDTVAEYLADLSSAEILSIARASEHSLPDAPERLIALAIDKLGRSPAPPETETLAVALRQEVQRQAAEIMES